VDTFILAGGAGCLLLVAFRLSRSGVRKAAGFVLCLLVVLQSAVQLRYGTWVAEPVSTPTLARMNEEKRVNLAFRGSAGEGMEPATLLKHPGVPLQRVSFRRLEAGSAVFGKDSIRQTYASFNRLAFHVEARGSGFLVLSVPYSPQWRASVDAAPTDVLATPWNQQEVSVPQGSHTVEFRFVSPASRAGMVASLATVATIGLLVSRSIRPALVRRTVFAAAILIPIGAFVLWHHSLYHGGDIGTYCVWESS
jgi:hypothetical protein